jgi:cellobiose phosphorylase
LPQPELFFRNAWRVVPDDREHERWRGGIRLATNPWITIANVRAGLGDRAFESYLLINPSAREDQSDVHRCEPYVYAQTIAGRDAATPGEARNSWLTGTAAWSFVAVTQWILGIRPEYAGLRVEPCIPSHWDGFQATRRFRGATYSISVRSATGVVNKTAEIPVNGQRLEGTLVPLAAPGSTVRVEVTLV